MRSVLIFMICAYQRGLSPIANSLFGPRCRFSPTCSQYAIDAIRKHGVLKGIGLSMHRIVRCNPYSNGGYDSVR